MHKDDCTISHSNLTSLKRTVSESILLVVFLCESNVSRVFLLALLWQSNWYFSVAGGFFFRPTFDSRHFLRLSRHRSGGSSLPSEASIVWAITAWWYAGVLMPGPRGLCPSMKILPSHLPNLTPLMCKVSETGILHV